MKQTLARIGGSIRLLPHRPLLRKPVFKWALLPITVAAVVALVAVPFMQLPVSAFMPDWNETQPAGDTNQKWSLSNISANGQIMLVGTIDNSCCVPDQLGRLYLSTDGGANWGETQPKGDVNNSWVASAMSADGQTMLVAGDPGRLYLTTDGGDNWAETQPAGDTDQGWPSLSMSADGQTMIAAANNNTGGVFVSTNAGTSWVETEPAGAGDFDWWLARVSGDGQTMMAGQRGTSLPGRLYLSINAGVSWAETQPAGDVDLAWQTGDISANGQIITAGVAQYAGQGIFGAFYVSTNGGTNWTYSPPTGGGGSIGQESPFATAMSADGQTIMVGMEDGGLFISDDAGGLWSPTEPPGGAGNQSWGTVSISADGESAMLAGTLVTRLWIGTPPPPPPVYSGNGSGTPGDPYQVTSCAQLQEIEFFPDADFILMNDIDCTGFSFTSITVFRARLDGDNHSITNLVTNGGSNSAGLFSATSGATVIDLTLAGGSATGGDYVGSVIGQAELTTITNVHSNQAVTGGGFCAGGLLGYGAFEVAIANSSATGSVIGNDYVGGLVGCIYSDSSVDKSFATGDVTEDATQDGFYLGGLIGETDEVAIADSYSLGDVSAGGGYAVGGFIGHNDEGSVTKSYSAGAVTVADNTDTPGGFIGSNEDSAITASMWNTTTNSSWAGCGTDSVDCNGILGRTTAQLQDKATFTTALGADTWNFTSVWGINCTDNNNYPFLAWQGFVNDAGCAGDGGGGDTPGGGGTGSSGGGGGSTPATHKPASSPLPIDLAVNITEGQLFSEPYNVVVSPLPGSQATYEKVSFYVDGVLLTVFYPDANGVASYLWDVNAHPGSHLTIIAYGSSGLLKTWDFNVNVAKKPAAVPIAQPSGPPAAPVSEGIDSGFGQWLLSIPAGFVFVFPYIMLLPLLVLLIILLYQSYREARAAEELQLAYLRAKQLAEEKVDFIALASHYLRTPLTLMKGGIDMLDMNQPPVNGSLLSGLGAAITAFGSSIEAIILRTEQNPTLQTVASPDSLRQPLRVWQSPMFWLPLAVAGLLLIIFNGTFVIAGVPYELGLSSTIQILVFIGLAIGLYVAVRNLLIARRDQQTAQLQADQQTALDDARNQVIRDGASTLTGQLKQIQSYVAQLPNSQSQQTLAEGCTRIEGTLNKFRAIASITPIPSTAPFVGFDSNALLSSVQKQVAPVAAEKQIAIKTGQNVPIASQQPGWVSAVVGSLLDNAVAFSPQGSEIAIDTQVKDGIATVTVQDHGQGIPQDKLRELFQPFAKAEGSMEFDHPGAGLSLYLDRLVATSMGGNIQMSSNVGMGTTVQMSFPAG